MDLLDFGNNEQEALYFEENLSEEVKALLDQAAQTYADGVAELPLLRAYFLASDSLTVLVALYRFYYYQHRYPDTLQVARKALAVSGARLAWPADWARLSAGHLTDKPMALVRFYLLALKGAAYVLLRQNQLAEGEAMLDKILELDPEDRLGASVLKNVLEEQRRKPRLVVSN